MFQVLVLEIDGPVIRCVVLARKGIKKLNITRWESFTRLEEEGAPLSADELAMITARLSVFPQNCVVVTSGAAFLHVSLPEPSGKKARRSRGTKLAAALRQEAEAYTGMAAAEMLLGYERLPEEDYEFWVTAYPQEEYLRLKELLADSGLKLKRVYPPDCCFAVAAACFAEPAADGVHLVLDAGSGALRLAKQERGRMWSYRTVPLFSPQPYSEFTREDWERLLTELGYEAEKLASVWQGRLEGEALGLVVTGAGSQVESVPLFLSSFFEQKAKPLVMPAGESASVGVCGGEYASVVGAGLRELLYPYLSGRTLGVSDQLPLLQTIAKKAYLAPVAVMLLSFAVIGGHYLLIIRQISGAEEELAILTRERDGVRAAVVRMQADEKRATELSADRLLLADQVDYLQNRLPEYSRLLHAVLAAMEKEADMRIKFVQIELLEQGRQFFVSGESEDSGSIHRLAVALQRARWNAFTKVEEIVREVREEEAAGEAELAAELPGPPPPEAGLLPGEELPWMEGAGEPMPMEPDPFAEQPAAADGAEGAEAVFTVVFNFRTRVVMRPEFFPERAFEEETAEEADGTGERAL
ncbi:MAG: cell division FtsA domain-containing protein [Clostridium sp.]|nr:cell division FtsA domain-containing protein [Clostridium sp.]